MKEIKTLEDALALVPNYWYLTLGVDKWKQGDEFCGWVSGFGEYQWQPVGQHKRWIMGDRPARRPIPKDVALSEARWILYNSFATGGQIRIRVCDPREEFDKDGPLFIDSEHIGFIIDGLKNFPTFEAVEKFINLVGGETAVIQMLTRGPGALFRWVQENRK